MYAIRLRFSSINQKSSNVRRRLHIINSFVLKIVSLTCVDALGTNHSGNSHVNQRDQPATNQPNPPACTGSRAHFTDTSANRPVWAGNSPTRAADLWLYRLPSTAEHAHNCSHHCPSAASGIRFACPAPCPTRPYRQCLVYGPDRWFSAQISTHKWPAPACRFR